MKIAQKTPKRERHTHIKHKIPTGATNSPYLRPVLLDILLRALENELTVLRILAPGGFQLLLPGRRPFLVAFSLLQQSLWNSRNNSSSFHLHTIVLRHRNGNTTLSLSLSLSLNSHTTDVKSPQDGNRKRQQLRMPLLSTSHRPSNPNPNPNPNFNGYDLNTALVLSDGPDRPKTAG